MINQCDKCEHFSFYVMVSVNDELFATCKAYPNGIPKDVFNDNVIHDKEIKGDNGIQFKRYVGVDRF